MKAPSNIPELRRFSGMVNQLGKFSKNLAELTQPLRELLSKKQTWLWGPSPDQAFSLVKAELPKLTVLALYNPEVATEISADASSYGVGAVLLRVQETDHKPLVPLITTKQLGSLPLRLLRLRLRLARFDYSIKHVLGKLLYTADTLSRAPTSPADDDTTLQE